MRQALALPEPDVLACLRHGFAAFVRHPLPLLAMAALVLLLLASVWQLVARGGALALLGCALGAFLAAPVEWGFHYACLRAVRGEPIGPGDLLRFAPRYPEAVLANALVSLGVLGGLFLLVVPGIVLHCRLRYVPYLVLDEDLPAGEALRTSLELTRGRAWPILWISLCGLALVLAGLPLLGIGGAFGVALGSLALASFYHAEVEPSSAAELLEDDLGWGVER